ncbi:MlaA family lipoprotein [Marinospirillum perlucidum]|uniref:MlaA family lipoprotein n=1 Tax=Marinospirillum perlucidum TaxID=1982602 RepID=UPI000DF1BD5C|nr:VacJ family lipoprotein [Marinospirillum perlucidum]
MQRIGWLLLLVLLLTGCASQTPQPSEATDWAEENPRDPFEDWNRSVFAFNDTLDTWFLKPVAQSYRWLTPSFFRTGVSNFFANLREPVHLVNNLLQAKPLDAGKDLLRFSINSSIGVLGLWDVATPLGLQPSEEDFGQTLNAWGLPEGPYLVWPVLGGQTLTHTLSRPLDYRLTPPAYIDDYYIQGGLLIVEGVNLRASLLDAERMISGDRYSFIRDAYMQRRDYLISDGELQEDPFLEDDFDDIDLDDAFAD